MENTSLKTERRFMEEFEALKEVEVPDGSDTNISKLR
jgi:hypothetical protein